MAQVKEASAEVASVATSAPGFDYWMIGINVGGALIVAIVAALLAAWFTMKFAEKSFVRQRLWEKRVEAYGAILEALYVMLNDYGEEIEAYRNGRVLTPEEIEESTKRYKTAKEAILQRVEVEQFLFPPELPEKIAEMLAGLRRAGAAENYFEHIDSCWAAINEARTEIRKIAKAQLKILHGL